MAIEKGQITKSLDLIVEKAEDAAILAKAQRKSADDQHDSANRQSNSARQLEELGRELRLDAAEIKSELKKTGGTTPKK